MNKIIVTMCLVCFVLGSSAAAQSPSGASYNLKVVSDASPDLTDLDSFIDSFTGSR